MEEKPQLVNINGILTLVSGDLKLSGDFSQMVSRLKPNNLNGEMLVKAAKFKNADKSLTAVDMTAGLGEDAFLLAASGFDVTMFEYDDKISALLEDALKRGMEIIEISDVLSKMHLKRENSIVGIKSLDFVPNVVYLDPMFPERQKSGLIKKKFQILQQLEKPCTNGEELFIAAKDIKPKKIIVKRPIKGENLLNLKPSYSIMGKSIRYDVYVI